MDEGAERESLLLLLRLLTGLHLSIPHFSLAPQGTVSPQQPEADDASRGSKVKRIQPPGPPQALRRPKWDGLKLSFFPCLLLCLRSLRITNLAWTASNQAQKHPFRDSLLPKLCLLAPCLVAVETGSTADKGGSWVLLPPGPVDEDF